MRILPSLQLFICRSWQLIEFPPRPVTFVRIIGTKNTANEVRSYSIV